MMNLITGKIVFEKHVSIVLFHFDLSKTHARLIVVCVMGIILSKSCKKGN